MSYLFMALRFAVLRDAEMLPVTLRRLIDSKSGQKVLVKTPEKAALIRAEPYSFDDLWNALNADLSRRKKKLPAIASRAELRKAEQIDFDIRRSVQRLLCLPLHNRPVDMQEAMTKLDALVLQGYCAD